MVAIITKVQRLGTVPLKFGSANNVQNSMRFWTIFDFNRKYLINR